MTHDQTGQPLLQEGGSAIGSVASDIKTAATQRFGDAVTEVRQRADGAKADVADEVNDVARALRRASEDLRGGSAQERTLGQISSGLADASDMIRDKDLGEIVQMASKVARGNPVLFLGGAALLGFAISRFAKASADHANGSAATKVADQKAQIDAFVDEGNPNTQPVQVTP